MVNEQDNSGFAITEVAITAPPSDIKDVYGGGVLMKIELQDLVGNEVAVKQLMNNHNDQANKRAEAERRLADKESEIAFLRTSPFIAVFALVFNTIGAVITGMATKWFTANPPVPHAGWVVFLGGACILVGGVLTVLYPYARRIFNRRSR
jgi:uncharacterized membrane protein YidH (DUF202 family)